MHGHEAAIGDSHHEDSPGVAVLIAQHIRDDLAKEADVIGGGRLAAQNRSASIVPVAIQAIGSDNNKVFLAAKRGQAGLLPEFFSILGATVEQNHERMKTGLFHRLHQVVALYAAVRELDFASRRGIALGWKFRVGLWPLAHAPAWKLRPSRQAEQRDGYSTTDPDFALHLVETPQGFEIFNRTPDASNGCVSFSACVVFADRARQARTGFAAANAASI